MRNVPAHLLLRTPSEGTNETSRLRPTAARDTCDPRAQHLPRFRPGRPDAGAGGTGWPGPRPRTRQPGPGATDVVLHHQHTYRQGWKPWRAGWRRRALSDPGGCRRCRQPRVAGLSQHPGPRGCQCAGPHRQGAMGQRQGAVGCARPGAPARRHPRPRAHGQHVDPRDGAQRERGTGAWRAVPGRSGARAGE